MFDAWQADIPKLSKGMGIIILLLNIFIPPAGTFLLACIGPEFKSSQIIVGLLQLLLLGILVGWVWSICWGLIVMEKAST